MSPPLLWALALLLAAAGMRARRAAAAGHGGVGVPPLLLRAAGRVPAPGAVCELLARTGDADRIARAGLSGALTPHALARARAGAVLVGVAVGATAALLAPAAAALVPALGGAGAAAPGWWLSRREGARRRELVRDLPDLLDLLGICVESGMALDPALRMSAGRLGGVLGSEVDAVLRDLAMGTPRARAYRRLTARVGAPELDRMVAALLHAEELGAPLSRALEGQAAALRAARRQDARERAARAAPKIQLVVAMVMVPAVLLLVIGVLLMELARQVGGVVG